MRRECLTQFGHQRIIVEALDCPHVTAIAVHCVGDAGALRRAVKVDRAGATNALFAAEMCPSEMQLFAQEIRQMRARLNQRLNQTAIHRQRNLRHVSCRNARRIATP